jgi:hypothetical protein
MESSNKRMKARRTGTLLAVGTILLVGIGFAWPRERRLTEVARTIGTIRKHSQLCWLSGHRVLIITRDGSPRWFRDRNGRVVKTQWQGTVDVLDTSTHTRIPMPAIAAVLQRLPGSLTFGPYGFKASPDDRWLFWTVSVETTHSPPECYAAGMDGSHYRRLYRCDNDASHFVGDHHLLQIMELNGSVIDCDLLDATRDRTYSQRQQAGAFLERTVPVQPISCEVVAPETEGGGAYAKIDLYRPEDQLDKHLVPPYDKRWSAAPLRTHTIKLPPGTTTGWATISPQQQTILYQLQCSRRPPFATWLHRLIPRFDDKPILTERLWVSRADGRGMHEIGFLPVQLDEDNEPMEEVSDLQWLPDGKQISFTYRGILYVASAEASG